MTTKAAISPEEWKAVVLEGPPTAGIIVVTVAHSSWTTRHDKRFQDGVKGKHLTNEW